MLPSQPETTIGGFQLDDRVAPKLIVPVGIVSGGNRLGPKFIWGLARVHCVTQELELDLQHKTVDPKGAYISFVLSLSSTG